MAETEAGKLPRGNGEQILVIDDEEVILQVTRRTLERYGYRVLTATDGAEGVATYVRNQSDIAVVITDMMMPIIDGAATIYALKRINPAVRIIAASGLATNAGHAKIAESGVKHFLAKPYTAEVVLQMINEVLHTRAG